MHASYIQQTHMNPIVPLKPGTSKEQQLLPKPIVSKAPGYLVANSENIGGRLIIAQNLKRHADQIKHVTKKIDNNLPWAYQAANMKLFTTGASNVRVSRQVSPNRTVNPVTRLSPMKNTKKKKKQFSLNLDEVPRFDPDYDLSNDQKIIYEQFVNMLCSLTVGKVAKPFVGEVIKEIALKAALEASERCLLMDYGEMIDSTIDLHEMPHVDEQFLKKVENDTQELMNTRMNNSTRNVRMDSSDSFPDKVQEHEPLTEELHNMDSTATVTSNNIRSLEVPRNLPNQNTPVSFLG